MIAEIEISSSLVMCMPSTDIVSTHAMSSARQAWANCFSSGLGRSSRRRSREGAVTLPLARLLRAMRLMTGFGRAASDSGWHAGRVEHRADHDCAVRKPLAHGVRRTRHQDTGQQQVDDRNARRDPVERGDSGFGADRPEHREPLALEHATQQHELVLAVFYDQRKPRFTVAQLLAHADPFAHLTAAPTK